LFAYSTQYAIESEVLIKDLFEAIENDPLITRITCALLKAYLEYCRNLHSVFDYSVWAEFKNVIITAYRAEIDSLHKVPLSKPVDSVTYQVLFNKGALIIWIILLTAALLSFGRRTLEPLLLKSAMFNLGKSIWIADDLADIVNDLDQGVWNYVTMKLNTEQNVPLTCNDGQIKDSEIVCSELLSTGVIELAANEMCESYYRSFQELNRLGYSTNNFNNTMLPWLNSWIK
jgi:hypothetical protein